LKSIAVEKLEYCGCGPIFIIDGHVEFNALPTLGISKVVVAESARNHYSCGHLESTKLKTLRLEKLIM
jgi:hypothetical protein